MPKNWKRRIHFAAETGTGTACNRYAGVTTTDPQAVTCGLCQFSVNGKPFIPHQDLSKRFWSKVDIKSSDECWEWQAFRDKNGYGRFRYRGDNVLAHRFAYQLTHGFMNDDKCLLHRCDNPPCVNPNHVFEGSRPENTLDMLAKGRMTRGSQRRNAKLNETQVAEIKRLLTQGVPQSTIAQLYGIEKSTISNIKRHKRWRHVVIP